MRQRHGRRAAGGGRRPSRGGTRPRPTRRREADRGSIGSAAEEVTLLLVSDSARSERSHSGGRATASAIATAAAFDLQRGRGATAGEQAAELSVLLSSWWRGSRVAVPSACEARQARSSSPAPTACSRRAAASNAAPGPFRRTLRRPSITLAAAPAQTATPGSSKRRGRPIDCSGRANDREGKRSWTSAAATTEGRRPATTCTTPLSVARLATRRRRGGHGEEDGAAAHEARGRQRRAWARRRATRRHAAATAAAPLAPSPPPRHGGGNRGGGGRRYLHGRLLVDAGPAAARGGARPPRGLAFDGGSGGGGRGSEAGHRD